MTSDRPKFAPLRLTPQQQGVLDRHDHRLHTLCEQLKERLREEPGWQKDSHRPPHHRYPPPWFKKSRKPTSFGILAPRGAGKTTVLAELLLKWGKGSDDVGRLGGLDNGFYAVKSIVDCSLTPPGIPLGLSVLTQLRVLLGLNDKPPGSARSLQGDPCSRWEPEQVRREDEKRAFAELEQAYVLSTAESSAVFQETAMSPAHYAMETAQAARRRFKLPDRVADWLEIAAELHGDNVEGFILPLDDIDLARQGVRDFVYSLLDELHQPRLLLLIAADLDLLEHKLADKKEPDPVPQTWRDVLYKVLPQVNREYLRPWRKEHRLAFPPGRESEDANAALDAFASDSRTLGELVVAHSASWDLAYRDPELLPPFPRALENLWFVLAGEDGEHSTATRLDEPAEYLAFLAEGRGEHLLARSLVRRPAEEWGRALTWAREALDEEGEAEETLDEEAWSLAVTAALEGRPLLRLIARSDELPMVTLSANDGARWTELLVDIALARGTLASQELATRIPALGRRLERARVRTDLHRISLQEQMTGVSTAVTSALTWTTWDVTFDANKHLEEVQSATIGWPDLLAAAGGRRRAWPTRLFQGLRLRGAEPATLEAGSPSGLYPRRLRALLLFADALADGPWPALSRRRTEVWRSHVLLSAALVHSAYLVAIDRVFNALAGKQQVNGDDRFAPDDAQRPFIDSFGPAGPTQLLAWHEDEIEARFKALLVSNAAPGRLGETGPPGSNEDATGNAGSPPADPEFTYATYNALVDALQAYRASPWFRGLARPADP